MRALLFFALLVLMGACQGEELEKSIISEYEKGKPMKVEHFKYIGDRKVVLKETRYYPNGEKEVEGGLSNGKRDGLWEYFKKDGFKWMEENYKEGALHGEFTVWYRSGDVNYQGEYFEGKPHGEWLFFNEDGSKSKLVEYEKGQKISAKDF